MYPPSNQLQAPQEDDEENKSEILENGYNCKTKHAFSASASNTALPKPKAKKRKAEIIEGRIMRSGGKKDRHSKVCTARGLKDRRVRLAPEIAIQFYDVQDRLGFDRPSKAIDWLINEAQAAVGALAEPPPFESQQMEVCLTDDIGNDDYATFCRDFQPGFWSWLNCYSQTSVANWEIQREPLQSSVINYSPISPDFQGFNFSNELAVITANAKLKEGEKDVFN